ncbi:MAG: hypothetical protein ACHQZR_02575 [Candidatus Limnocylindrales bacterium]
MTAERKPFLLRLDSATMGALRAWAGDDLRSLNGQIEYLLRRALREAGRLPAPKSARQATGATSDAPDRRDAAAVPALPTRRDRT